MPQEGRALATACHGVPWRPREKEGHSGGDLVGGSPTTPGLALTFTAATLACRVTSGKSPSHLDTELLQLKLKPKLANRAPKPREAWKAANPCPQPDSRPEKRNRKGATSLCPQRCRDTHLSGDGHRGATGMGTG